MNERTHIRSTKGNGYNSKDDRSGPSSDAGRRRGSPRSTPSSFATASIRSRCSEISMTHQPWMANLNRRCNHCLTPASAT